MSNRMQNTARNAIYGYIYQITYMSIGVISRFVFIKYLGKDYLGINGLFSNILGVLSISELGVGAAIGYALYTPLAENDKERIKSIMLLFKKLYRFIGIFMSIIGIAIIPILPYIINNTTGLENLTLYYSIFLLNTVIGYFISYKNTLITSDQKEYKIKKVATVGSLVLAFVQMLVLIFTKNYLLYLLSDVSIRIVMQLVNLKVIDKEYPYLKKEKTEKLPKEDLKGITQNVKALMVHKIGEVSVGQTDNIIISAFISLEMAGIVSNYTMFISYATMFISTILSAAIPSMGNLIAKESVESKVSFFKIYRMLSYWLHGWVALGFIFLASPLVSIVFGESYVLNQFAVFLMGMVIFLKGEGTALYNYKVAAGMYNDDKYLAFIGGAINLVVSIVAVNLIGIAGVYVGTFVCTIFSVISRAIIIYNKAFENIQVVVVGIVKYILFFCVSYLSLDFISKYLLAEITSLNFFIMFLACVAIPNIVLMLLFFKEDEFKYYANMIFKLIRRE